VTSVPRVEYPGMRIDRRHGHTVRAPRETIDGLESPSMTSGDPDPAPDSRALLVDEETFTLVVELEVRQAIRLQYYVCLLVLQADTEERRPDVDWTTLHRLVAEAIRDYIRNTDLVSVRTTPPHVRVLLVSPSLENLPDIIGRIMGAVNGRPFDVDGDAVHVTLSMGGACFPTTARSRAELVRQAQSLSAEARAEAGRSGHRYRVARRTL
jgi:hypothetical protein